MIEREAVERYLNQQMPAAIEMLRRMVEINSFTANAAGVNQLGLLTAECFAPLGFTPEFIPSANPSFGRHLVLSRPGSSRRNLACVAHLDTVFSPEEEQANDFRWRPEGDWIFGPGTNDMKGGTVMIWLVLSALRAQAPVLFDEIGWKILCNSSEECYSPDFGDVCRRHFDEHTIAALVFEGENRKDGERCLVIARKGRGTWRVTVRGRGAHAGGKHEMGANAAAQLAETVQQITALTDYSRNLTFNVGTLRSGVSLNRVPHEACAEGEFRAFDTEVYADAKAALMSLAGPGSIRSPADGFAASVSVEMLTESSPWPRNQGSDRLFQVWKAAAERLGQQAAPECRGGLSDGNLIWANIPTLDGLGPWGENAHCSERSSDGSKLPEFVEIGSFVPKALLNCCAIVDMLDPARGGR